MRIHSARLQFHKSVEFILFSVYNQVVVPACMVSVAFSTHCTSPDLLMISCSTTFHV